ncbi:hypothetical protein [Gephyromycinifex aptenodytis]|uniref:hypothetical protein n=1 Tax=Gephyromycinifex aptenodytis TaxID=2716227 RepID=UPI0014471443|nr:hypothetical protein [Gephyromycinifex aptenodytis]
MNVSDATTVNTSRLVALGLLGGFVVASESGVRPLGGLVLGAAGAFAARTWLAKTDPATTAALTGIYLGGMGLSHPLAKKIGAWPAVFAVTGISAGAAHVLSDRLPEHRKLR